jgi:hypothetical protein
MGWLLGHSEKLAPSLLCLVFVSFPSCTNLPRLYGILVVTSRPRPRVAVALPGDCLAVNVRLNDIVTFLDVTKLR